MGACTILGFDFGVNKNRLSQATGLEIVNIQNYGNLISDTLGLKEDNHRKRIIDTLKTMTMVKTQQAGIQEVTVVINEFSSVFGFLAAVVEPEGTVAVAWTFHTLTFKMLTQDGQIFHFTPDDIRAINVSFCKHRALENLVNEGIISKINYI